jgi:retron-type reverse transcriptase
VQQAQAYIQEGYDWVVDIDLEKFFDCTHHEEFLDKVERTIK